jgi:hypothetical protein
VAGTVLVGFAVKLDENVDVSDVVVDSSEQQIKVTSPVQHQTSFSDTNIVGHQPSETVFPGVSISPRIFSQITDGQAVETD